MKHIKLFEEYSSEILYHGTDSDDIAEFKLNKLGERSSKFGFFFTDDVGFADMFGSNVLEYRVTLNNPKIITHDEWYEMRDIKNGDDYFISYRESLIENGYDSVLIERDDSGVFTDPKIVIVFNPSQIKKV